SRWRCIHKHADVNRWICLFVLKECDFLWYAVLENLKIAALQSGNKLFLLRISGNRDRKTHFENLCRAQVLRRRWRRFLGKRRYYEDQQDENDLEKYKTKDFLHKWLSGFIQLD